MNSKQYLGALLVLMISGFFGGAVMTVFLQGKPLMAATYSRVISAQEFRLVDSNGKVRANLDVDDKGNSGLSLFDENGKDRADLALLKSNPVLDFADENGKTRVSLNMLDKGNPSLDFSENGEDRASLYLDNQGNPSLDFVDEEGKARLILGNASLITPSTGANEETGAASLVMFDPDGNSIWKAP